MPQVTTSSEAGPGTKIIYCIIIHICLWWNLYMRMDDSLVHFIRVAGGTFRRWIYPDNPPCLLPDIQMIQMFFKPASHWPSSRALIGRYGPWLGDTGPDWAIRGGGPSYVTAIHFLPAHSINIKHLRRALWKKINILSFFLSLNSVVQCVHTYTRWTWQSEIWHIGVNM